MSLSDFFNTYLNPIKIMESKREYKEQIARVKALPEGYRYVFEKMQQYMWMFSSGDGMDMLKLHYNLIELFEDGAANGKHVLDVTGEDVATFCDELLRSAGTYTENWREKLNRDVIKKVGKGTNRND